jgi:hypothetical protein
MTVQRKPPQPERWTRQNEENLTLEIAEDKRLLGLGINPDGDAIEIMLQLSRLVQSFSA